MYESCESIDSYPTELTMAEKIGNCCLCNEAIFSDEEIWMSAKGNGYYCIKCIEESERKERTKKQAELESLMKELMKSCMKCQIVPQWSQITQTQ